MSILTFPFLPFPVLPCLSSHFGLLAQWVASGAWTNLIRLISNEPGNSTFCCCGPGSVHAESHSQCTAPGLRHDQHRGARMGKGISGQNVQKPCQSDTVSKGGRGKKTGPQWACFDGRPMRPALRNLRNLRRFVLASTDPADQCVNAWGRRLMHGRRAWGMPVSSNALDDSRRQISTAVEFSERIRTLDAHAA
jgi:hypothetical protein